MLQLIERIRERLVQGAYANEAAISHGVRAIGSCVDGGKAVVARGFVDVLRVGTSASVTAAAPAATAPTTLRPSPIAFAAALRSSL